MGPGTQLPLRAGPNPRMGALAFRSFGIAQARIAGRSVPVREEVSAHLPFAQLRRFARPGPAHGRVLVVAPLAGAFPYLMRDLVAGLLGLAAEVVITDWPDARHVPMSCGRFGFEDNVRAVAGFAEALAAQPGGPLHMVGICQGVVAALAAASLMAEEGRAPASLTLIGGPVDAARNPTRLDRLLARSAPEELEATIERVPSMFPGAGRQVFPRGLQMQAFGFYLYRQALAGADLPRRLLLDEGSDPLRFPLARLCWDMMDIPADFFLGNVEQVFRRRALACGTLALAGRVVRPQALSRTALLTIEGERDDISAPGQTVAAHALCAALPTHLRAHRLVPGAGHFSLFYGNAMRAEVLPAISDIMRRAPEGEP